MAADDDRVCQWCRHPNGRHESPPDDFGGPGLHDETRVCGACHVCNPDRKARRRGIDADLEWLGARFAKSQSNVPEDR